MLPTPVLRLLNVLDGEYLENEEEYEGQCCGARRVWSGRVPRSPHPGPREGADCVGSEPRSPFDPCCSRPPTLLRRSPAPEVGGAGAAASGGHGLGGVMSPGPMAGSRCL